MIYTAGYAGHSAQALKQLAENLDATVVDIRYNRQSANPSFTFAAMAALLGERYTFIRALGNINYKGGPIKLFAPEAGIRELQAMRGNLILLCMCSDFDTCHRKQVAALLPGTQEVTAAQWNAATLDRVLYGNSALSIRQPWAWLIVHGYKNIENRDWYTPMRGEFWIHTGKQFDKDGLRWVREHFPGIALPIEFKTGGIIGKAILAGCFAEYKSPWFFGPYGFLIEQAQEVPFVPLPGKLGFFSFTMPEETAPIQAGLF